MRFGHERGLSNPAAEVDDAEGDGQGRRKCNSGSCGMRSFSARTDEDGRRVRMRFVGGGVMCCHTRATGAGEEGGLNMTSCCRLRD